MKVFGKKYNIYEIKAKVDEGKKTSWIENAIIAGFNEDEIERMASN